MVAQGKSSAWSRERTCISLQELVPPKASVGGCVEQSVSMKDSCEDECGRNPFVASTNGCNCDLDLGRLDSRVCADESPGSCGTVENGSAGDIETSIVKVLRGPIPSRMFMNWPDDSTMVDLKDCPSLRPFTTLALDLIDDYVPENIIADYLYTDGTGQDGKGNVEQDSVCPGCGIVVIAEMKAKASKKSFAFVTSFGTMVQKSDAVAQYFDNESA